MVLPVPLPLLIPRESAKSKAYSFILIFLLILQILLAALRVYCGDYWGALKDLLIVYCGYLSLRERLFLFIYTCCLSIYTVIQLLTVIAVYDMAGRLFDPDWTFKENMLGAVLLASPVITMALGGASYLLYKSILSPPGPLDETAQLIGEHLPGPEGAEPYDGLAHKLDTSESETSSRTGWDSPRKTENGAVEAV